MLGIKARTTIAVVLVAAAIGAIGAGAPSADAYKCPSTDPCGSVESLEHKCQLLGELNQSEAKANEAYAKEGNMAGANETAENLDRGHQLEETYGCHDCSRRRPALATGKHDRLADARVHVENGRFIDRDPLSREVDPAAPESPRGLRGLSATAPDGVVAGSTSAGTWRWRKAA
jgi:hypothetical protein